jgi:outer membrane cobalamin receptor
VGWSHRHRWFVVAAAAFCVALARDAHADESDYVTTIQTRRTEKDGATVSRVQTTNYNGESRHVGEIVATSPGTAPLDFGGVLATTTVSVRGASSDQAQVVLGGVPLNPASGGGFDLSLIPAALIDTAEVRRGSDGAQFGAGAMAGAVVLEPVSRSRVLITGGSLGTWGGSGSWASQQKTADEWRWLGALDFRRSKGAFGYHRDPTPELPNNDPLLSLTRQNNDATLASVLVRGERVSSGPVSMSGLAWFSGSDRGLAGPIYTPTLDARQRELTGFVDLRAKVTPAASTYTIEAPLTVRAGAYTAFVDGAFDAAPLQRTVDVSTRPSLTWRLSRWTLNASALGGWERFDSPMAGTQFRVRGALGATVGFEGANGSAALTLRGERWGAASAILPRAGGTLRLSKAVSLNTSVGVGFRPPSFGELYYSSGPLIPNPDLKPERSLSADVGLKVRHGGFSLGLTTFVTQYEDIILYEIYPGFRAKPFNIGRARSIGGEVEVRYRPPFEALRGLSFTGAFTELLATNLEPGANSYGMRLPYRPQHRGIARVDLQRDRWRTALELQATGEAFINRANTRTLGAYTDLRCSAGVRIAGPFWISAEMRNGLNVMDRMTIDGYPMPGRVVLAHLSWEPDAP